MRKITQSRAPDEVMDQIAGLIRRGELKVGERLPSEKSLAETFGVSRPVVREAFRGLRSLGFISSRMGSGSYVSDGNILRAPLLLGRYTVMELHEVRTHLEVPAAALAAQRATDEQIGKVQSLVEQMDQPRDHRSFAELDAAFHVALAECTGNSIHTHLVADLHELIVENSDLALSASESRQAQAGLEHRRIADALIRRDEQAAERAVREHLSRVAGIMNSNFGDDSQRRASRPRRRPAHGTAARHRANKSSGADGSREVADP